MAKKSFKINSSLATAMNETVSAAKNNAGDLHVEIIPLHKIKLDQDNPRELNITITDITQGINKNDPLKKIKQIEKDSLSSISKSILDQGIINPVLVYKDEDSYQLIAGERRTLGSFLASKIDIPAKVLTVRPNPLKLSLLQWIENIERKDLSLGEKVNNLTKIVSAYTLKNKIAFNGIKVEELGELLGCSTQLASNYKVVMNSSKNLLSAINLGKINNLKKAALICRSPEYLESILIDECIRGATEKNLKDIVTKDKKEKINSVTNKSRDKKFTKFKLGATSNPKVAKIILDSLLLNPVFTNVKKHIEPEALSDPKYLNKVFNDLIKLLEEA